MADEPGKWGGGAADKSTVVENDKHLAEEEESDLIDAGKSNGGFKDYQSVSRFFSTLTSNENTAVLNDLIGENGVESKEEENWKRKRKLSSTLPPWRKYIGKTFLELESPIAEYTPETEWDIYMEILESTFSGFSHFPIGSDIEIIDFTKPIEIQGDLTFEIDVRPDLVGLEDSGGDVLYDEPFRGLDEITSKGHNNATCWNCLSQGHAYTSCPEPKNHMMIRHSREAHLFHRDFVMPEYVQPALDMYLTMQVTQEEKNRRLELVDKFQAGSISRELEDAICFIDEDALEGDSEGYLVKEQVDIKRRRKRWDWYEKIMRWGYPPGWITTKDPMQEVRRRIEGLEFHEKAFELDDEQDEDQLKIIGGTLGTPTSSIIDGDSSETDSASTASLTSSPEEGQIDENSQNGDQPSSRGNMEDNSSHNNLELSATVPKENHGFLPPSPISRPVIPPKSPDHYDLPPPPDDPSPPPSPLDDVVPPSPPFPPPDDDIPPPPPPADNFPAPPSPVSHSNPFLQRHYELQAHARAEALRSAAPVTPPNAPRAHRGQPPFTPVSSNTPSNFNPTYPLSLHYKPSSSIPSMPNMEPQSMTRNRSNGSTKTGPPSMPKAMTPARRWVKYHTDLFDSERLVPYWEGKPFPLGHW
ncbi:uncharacterized protein I206_104251 [Kwoniella pini CBS 10737]|uniref:Uncharacterized protein n=1 Tax=Kwoniella pini CBS 10737 TaxID=1296096 RepID=A0A1B9I271_9TREE|nr:uncharacterized protein I206_04172 [Kwoniella pini CBS 10737]OCF49650.1 hypothetical protein I206_04172 [Kwoniella pini CBS 10737]